jgi:hypothetical protein
VGRLTIFLSAVAGGAIAAVLAWRSTHASALVTLALVALATAVVAVAFLARAATQVLPFSLELPFTEIEDALAQPEAAAVRLRMVSLLSFAHNGQDLHERFKPLVVGVARHLLASRARIDLYAEPERARAVVGPQVWDLIQPGRLVTAQEDSRSAPGLDRRQLATLVDELERLAELRR